jgi:hypothetical protein
VALPTVKALKQLPGYSLESAFKKFSPTVLNDQTIVDDPFGSMSKILKRQHLFATSLGPLTSEIVMIDEESLKDTKQIQ